MTKPELGTKRLCAKCSARYYDLNKTPITCPKCGTPFEVVANTTGKRSGPRAVVSQPEVEPEEARLRDQGDLARRGRDRTRRDG